MSEITFDELLIENFSCIKKAKIPLNKVGMCSIEGKVLNDDSTENEDDNDIIEGAESESLRISSLYSPSMRSNGAGKSSIVEAFYFGLTGEFFDSDTTLFSVINRFIGKSSNIILSGWRNEEYFKIHRLIELKSKRSTKAAQILKFFIGDVNIHEQTSSNSQTQEKINEFLGINPLLLINSKIFGQGDISSFTQVNDRQKKIIIDNMVGVGVCEKLYRQTSTTLSEINTVATSLGIELINLNKQKEALSIELAGLEQSHLNWEDTKKNELVSLSNKVDDLIIKKVDLEKNNEVFQANLTESETENGDKESISTKIKEGRKLLPVLDEKLGKAYDVRNQIIKDQSFYFGILQRVDGEIEKLQKIYTSEKTVCPTCKQSLNMDNLAKIKGKLAVEKNEINSKMQEKTFALSDAEKEIEKWTGIKKDLDKAIEGLEKNLDDKNKAENLINEIKKKIERNQFAIESLDNNIAQLKQIYSEKEQAASPYIELVQNKKIQLIEIVTTVKDKEIESAGLEKDIKYITLLNRAFNRDGIPHLISADVLQVLNKLLQKYKARILGNTFEIEYRMAEKRNSEEISLHISNPQGGDGYNRQSKGEKKKIDLCQMFAISDFANMQNKCKFNVIWFDEVFAELDTHSCEIILELIKESEADSKFVITHKEMFKDEFKHHIIAEKAGRTANIFFE